ncbi:MAG: hypothetical protein MZW92_29495 [Comamonadaceae bacterium]|nr:hypothetical protein [Comamonadaceae bacterium]
MNLAFVVPLGARRPGAVDRPRRAASTPALLYRRPAPARHLRAAAGLGRPSSLKLLAALVGDGRRTVVRRAAATPHWLAHRHARPRDRASR